MRGLYVLVVALATLAGVSSASAQIRIAEDRGGQIGSYLQHFAVIRASGERVIIDGNCLSACTLVLGTVPQDRICVTARANLGFHAAWDFAPNGRPVFSEEGTRLLWDFYPANIRRWIERKGGLTAKMIYLRGAELRSMFASCSLPARTASARQIRTARTAGNRSLFAASAGPM